MKLTLVALRIFIAKRYINEVEEQILAKKQLREKELIFKSHGYNSSTHNWCVTNIYEPI